MKPIEVVRLPEFDRDLKYLLKRYPTLEEDLEIFIKASLIPYHEMNIDNKGILPVPGVGYDQPKIYKVKKFACRSLKGKGAMSGIRLIYAYFEADDRVVLIEIYYKGEQETEDRKRLEQFRPM